MKISPLLPSSGALNTTLSPHSWFLTHSSWASAYYYFIVQVCQDRKLFTKLVYGLLTPTTEHILFKSNIIKLMLQPWFLLRPFQKPPLSIAAFLRAGLDTPQLFLAFHYVTSRYDQVPFLKIKTDLSKAKKSTYIESRFSHCKMWQHSG